MQIPLPPLLEKLHRAEIASAQDDLYHALYVAWGRSENVELSDVLSVMKSFKLLPDVIMEGSDLWNKLEANIQPYAALDDWMKLCETMVRAAHEDIRARYSEMPILPPPKTCKEYRDIYLPARERKILGMMLYAAGATMDQLVRQASIALTRGRVSKEFPSIQAVEQQLRLACASAFEKTLDTLGLSKA